MANSPEEIHKAVRNIIIIGLILGGCTIATVLLSYYEFPTHSINIIVGMILATIKAAFVALIFMHLNHEAKLIYKILAFTVAFAAALFLLFVFSSHDPLVFSGFYESNQ
ncbi:Cytochrome C oxidase subunit IV [Prosthecobacter debontii]|uniref:Cytochrome C oxidase subunit IV n=1 Tax=Prosthecobacter debontii TaxID=48467 RepID=A0A1T4YTV6_9BACT|nr:cytochrome C oxidase subunit IV family protein [Prosthecobacter debontii]SKB04675.1 Cytochrome C oxidase subunit IV [Prosthecobacter debontii]